MGKILVPIDFSAANRTTMDLAVAIAKPYQASVVLYHTTPLAVGMMDPAHPPVELELQMESDKRAKAHLEELLAPYAAVCYPGTNDPVRIEAETTLGDLTPSIKLYAKNGEVDLVVMDTRGADGTLFEWMGSNATDVLAAIDVPMLIVPRQHEAGPIRHIVLATDFEEPDHSYLDDLLSLANAFGAVVHVVHVEVDAKSPVNYIDIRVEEEVAKVHFTQIKSHSVEAGINAFAESVHADMIAVFRPKRPFIDSLFHRSISKRLALHAKVPLLVMRP